MAHVISWKTAKELSVQILKVNMDFYSWAQIITTYRINRIYSDRQAFANSVDPDETSQNAASHQGLHCLSLIYQFLDTTSGSKLYSLKF